MFQFFGVIGCEKFVWQHIRRDSHAQTKSLDTRWFLSLLYMRSFAELVQLLYILHIIIPYNHAATLQAAVHPEKNKILQVVKMVPT